MAKCVGYTFPVAYATAAMASPLQLGMQIGKPNNPLSLHVIVCMSQVTS